MWCLCWDVLARTANMCGHGHVWADQPWGTRAIGNLVLDPSRAGHGVWLVLLSEGCQRLAGRWSVSPCCCFYSPRRGLVPVPVRAGPPFITVSLRAPN